MDSNPLDRLKYHVTGAIERGEGTAVTSMTHTPGPWKIETYHGPLFGIVRDHDPKKDPVPEYRTKADARLIAASPDMFEALEAVFQARAPGFNFDFSNAPDMQMVIEAIKKAKGDM